MLGGSLVCAGGSIESVALGIGLCALFWGQYKIGRRRAQLLVLLLLFMGDPLTFMDWRLDKTNLALQAGSGWSSELAIARWMAAFYCVLIMVIIHWRLNHSIQHTMPKPDSSYDDSHNATQRYEMTRHRCNDERTHWISKYHSALGSLVCVCIIILIVI